MKEIEIAGNFYSCTGIVITDLVIDKPAKTISIVSQNGESIAFIGKDGVNLQTTQSNQATYQVVGNELYVRAKVSIASKQWAWTQPVFVVDFPD